MRFMLRARSAEQLHSCLVYTWFSLLVCEYSCTTARTHRPIPLSLQSLSRSHSLCLNSDLQEFCQHFLLSLLNFFINVNYFPKCPLVLAQKYTVFSQNTSTFVHIRLFIFELNEYWYHWLECSSSSDYMCACEVLLLVVAMK